MEKGGTLPKCPYTSLEAQNPHLGAIWSARKIQPCCSDIAHVYPVYAHDTYIDIYTLSDSTTQGLNTYTMYIYKLKSELIERVMSMQSFF